MARFNGAFLDDLMADKCASEKWLCKEMIRRGCSGMPVPHMVKRWTSGIGGPNAENVALIANIFGVKIEDFYKKKEKNGGD
jgi:hypothetical protein